MFKDVVDPAGKTPKNRLTVIYVPGLGDDKPRGQRWLVKSWRCYGVKPIFCQLNWGDGQPFAPKLAKIIKLIDEQASAGNQVALVGASAGGGAVINAFAARKSKVAGVVVICGKINQPESIDKSYRRRSPAFAESAYSVQKSLDHLDFNKDRTRILSRYAWFDPVIPAKDSQVAGGRNQAIFSFGHATTIARELSIGAPAWLKFLKNLAK
jgi:pimeloyl-ACP methyl ester carboxylesterase